MPSLAATLAVDTIALAHESPRLDSTVGGYVQLRCPVCRTDLFVFSHQSLAQSHAPIECVRCQEALLQRSGIWLALPIDRQAYYSRFLRDYELVRKAEGRGSENPFFYRSLPFADITRRNSWQWSIRARTYRHIERKLLPALSRSASRPLDVLDLGAGNAWLSYRLARLGHRPIAVDLQCNAFDGLGAAVHFQSELPSLFPRFQAELDRLPFADDQFDCAIFNASFHYSENYDSTLAEAIRCLRPGGTVIVSDSPYYRREESGLKMLEERRRFFHEHFGFRSDGLSSCEYLTDNRLLALEARHDLQWNIHRVWYGLRWSCRPLLAYLRGRREPSKFRIYTAQVKTA